MCTDQNGKLVTSGDHCTTFNTFSTHYTAKSKKKQSIFYSVHVTSAAPFA